MLRPNKSSWVSQMLSGSLRRDAWQAKRSGHAVLPGADDRHVQPRKRRETSSMPVASESIAASTHSASGTVDWCSVLCLSLFFRCHGIYNWAEAQVSGLW